MDDCVFNTVGDYFYRSSCQLLEEVFGRDALRVIDKGHEVYHNVYDFGETGAPYMQGQHHPAIGVFIEDRLAYVSTQPISIAAGRAVSEIIHLNTRNLSKWE